jgi:hypothetical protein
VDASSLIVAEHGQQLRLARPPAAAFMAHPGEEDAQRRSGRIQCAGTSWERRNGYPMASVAVGSDSVP